jgi:hypothetical protein
MALSEEEKGKCQLLKSSADKSFHSSARGTCGPPRNLSSPNEIRAHYGNSFDLKLKAR